MIARASRSISARLCAIAASSAAGSVPATETDAAIPISTRPISALTKRPIQPPEPGSPLLAINVLPPCPATVHGCPRRGKIPAGRGLRFTASDTQIAVQQLGGGSEFGGDAGPYRSAFFEDVVAVRGTQPRRDGLVRPPGRPAALLQPRHPPPHLAPNTPP